MGEIHTRVYSRGVLEAEDFPVADVSEYLDRPETIVWVDFAAPSVEQLRQLADELGLHELAVEDALGPHQRPKLDHYATHLFLSCHTVRLDSDKGQLETSEIDAFINTRWLVTVRENDGLSLGEVFSRLDRSPDLAAHGVSFLVYSLLDVIVDGYFETVYVFDEYYDDISEGIFSEHPLDPSKQRQWFEMRQSLIQFRRLAAPLREAVSGLMRRDSPIVPQQLFPYFQDVYDHILRVDESADDLRDLVATIVETNIGLRDYRQNQIVKKVTSWAAIIAVPTLITGFYGMNVPYPGSGRTSGVIVSAALIVIISGSLYFLFRRNDWL